MASPIVWALGIGAAGYIGYVLLSGAPKKDGYYVLLYNYPKGNRDRRLKSWNGPYASKAEADDNAEDEKDVWYPQVRHLKDDPRSLGM